VWAIVVVGLVDNIVKPWLLKGQIEIHGAVVFFALLGGIAVFGAIGLVAGPLVVAFFLATVRLYQRDFGVDAVGLSGGDSDCP
jgi:predicted PurR-regulated permease PerM